MLMRHKRIYDDSPDYHIKADNTVTYIHLEKKQSNSDK